MANTIEGKDNMFTMLRSYTVGTCQSCGTRGKLYNMGAYDFCLKCVARVQRTVSITLAQSTRKRLDLELSRHTIDRDGRGARSYYKNGTIFLSNPDSTVLDLLRTISHETLHYVIEKHIGIIESYQFDRLAYTLCHGYTWYNPESRELGYGYIEDSTLATPEELLSDYRDVDHLSCCNT